MKILFLDVDGVLNTTEMFRDSITTKVLGEKQLDLLQMIVKKCGCKIVLSSTWRLYEDHLQFLQKKLESRGVKIFDYTPICDLDRHMEIEAWLFGKTRMEFDKFAIIDDWEDAKIEMLDVKTGKQNGKFFLTNEETGLTEEITNQIIEFFGD